MWVQSDILFWEQAVFHFKLCVQCAPSYSSQQPSPPEMFDISLQMHLAK